MSHEAADDYRPKQAARVFAPQRARVVSNEQSAKSAEDSAAPQPYQSA